jgi:carboxylesterase type B
MLPASAIGTYNANDFANYINTQVAYPQRFGAENAANVGQRIFDFYNKNSGLQNESSTFYIHQYTELISDLLFTLPIVQEIEQKVQNCWPIFMYIFKYFNEAGFPPTFPIKGKIKPN